MTKMDWDKANRRELLPLKEDESAEAWLARRAFKAETADRGSGRLKAGTMNGAPHGPLKDPHRVNGRRVLYLRVPFDDKDKAKAAGAKYNPDRRAWWIFADLDDRRPFAEWLPPGEKVGAVADRRTGSRKNWTPRSGLDRAFVDAMGSASK